LWSRGPIYRAPRTSRSDVPVHSINQAGMKADIHLF
jgi:hypothetical protein